jgi:hypothetical protein
MPLAISVTVHRVEYQKRDDGKLERIITWLGRNAVDNALNGKRFHQSSAAHKRVDIEVAEAKAAQDRLDPNIAQVFISPKMSPYDAPIELARAENLSDEDSLRVSCAITNTDGVVVARKLESLLVRDIPLQAWIDMLKDKNNIFGRSFDIKNEMSAISVMELFDQLELPNNSILNGPVTLVESVLPYITDPVQHQSVKKQLTGFQGDQAKYKKQAEKTAQQWLDFDIELAKSLQNGFATFEITRFITSLQHHWNNQNLEIINAHQFENYKYLMTDRLAALLEDAKRQTLNILAGLLTGNEKMSDRISAVDKQKILTTHEYLASTHSKYLSENLTASIRIDLERMIADLNISPSGGCAGSTANNFKTLGDIESKESTIDKKSWKWKIGKCQVKTCPSPNPTEVGPCNVCRKCQDKFDSGDNPL